MATDEQSASSEAKPKLRRKSSVDGGTVGDLDGDGELFWDWDNESIPLKPKGKRPKFIKPRDKHVAFEGENGFVAFQVEGNPAPTVNFFKGLNFQGKIEGFKDLNVEPRYHKWTDGTGESNLVIMGVKDARQEEEGDYKCVIENTHGEAEFEFKLFVTVEGGMDFRAMLLKRKINQKKVVVKIPEWLERPVDKEAKENKDRKVVFTARLSEKEKKGRWYLSNQTTHQDIRATEHGVEIHRDDYDGTKYDMAHRGDIYVLTIHRPTVRDIGRYTVVVRVEKDVMACSGYLEVKDADPEYFFVKKFKPKLTAYTNRQMKLVCYLNQPGAKIKWLKDGKPLSFGDSRYERYESKDKLVLIIRKAGFEDSGTYGCEIQQFCKDGEDDLICCAVDIEEYPHTFLGELTNTSVVEHDEAQFEIGVEADDADVSWYQNGKKIVPDEKRVQILAEGKRRRLVFKDTLLSDAGDIMARTNRDKAGCRLAVAHANRFLTPLPSKLDAVEREASTFTVEAKDPDAPVEFFIGGRKIEEGDPRVEVKRLGNGKHQLLVNAIEMADDGTIEARTPSNYGDGVVTCSCSFTVAKGEEKPQIGETNGVTGVANKECHWTVPFQVEGVPQSEVLVSVLKDGKELRIGQDVNLSMQGNNCELSVINPKREKSGVYTVVVKNAQGKDERDIYINIMDKPDPPQSCSVSDVFYDSCVVHWTPPVDDGGTDIRNYVIEALDVSEGGQGGQWAEVAKTDSGRDRDVKVEGLRHRHNYRFRARAVNKIGQSEACEMLGEDILIKDPWDEPSTPGAPNVVDWGPNHCDLSWKPPESDGGAPITHYEIEYMEKNLGMWQPGQTLSLQDVRDSGGLIHGTCKGLVEGCEYVFRVKAVNKGGPSKPSAASEAMIAKARFLRPFLKQPGMYDLEVRKGRTFRYDIWFGGEPAPTVSWERNGVVLQPGDDGGGDADRISIELFAKKTVYCERNTVVTVTKADRAADSGLYKIRLVCEAGVQEATGRVNVLDVPERPRSLRPDEVRAEHITMAWETPEDDGGSPIQGYQVRMMDVETGDWITVAETDKLSSKIDGLRPGHLYQFEVYAINKEGVSLPIRTREPIKAENPYHPPSQPRDPQIVDFDHKSATLLWHPPLNDGGRPITHYVIQKKDKFGGWFDAFVTDSTNCRATIDDLEARVPGLSLGKWYQFRVVAVNKAGESPPSTETKPHLCRHKNLPPCIEKVSSGSKTVKTNRSAVWQIRVRGEPPPMFSWFKDGRKLIQSEEFGIRADEYQGGAVAMLQICRTQMCDAGQYTLVAENRNGTDKIDLDLIVLDPMKECDCDMFKHASLGCCCSRGFRYGELSAQQILMVDFGEEMPLSEA